MPPATPVGAVWGHLADRIGAGAPPDGLRYALNHAWTLPGAPLRDGDEMALVLPCPAGDPPAARAARPRGALRRGRPPRPRATVGFLGTTRREADCHEVEALDYEVYEELALAEMRATGAELGRRSPSRAPRATSSQRPEAITARQSAHEKIPMVRSST